MNTAISDRACSLPSKPLELFAEVIQKGQIERADRYRLRTVILNYSLTEEENDSITRLLYSVRRGLLKLVD